MRRIGEVRQRLLRTRPAGLVADAVQVDPLHRIADEVLDVLLERAERHVTLVGEVVLERQIEVVGLEWQQARIVLSAGRIESADQRRAARRRRNLARREVEISGARDRLAVREPRLQRVGEAEVEVEVRQQVVVAAITRDQGFVADVRPNYLEVVVVLPEQRRGHEDAVGRAHLRFLVPRTDHEIARHGAELELEPDLRVHRLRVFGHGAVGVEARVETQLAIRRRGLGPVAIAVIERPLAQHVRVAFPAAGRRADRGEVVERAGEAERREQGHHVGHGAAVAHAPVAHREVRAGRALARIHRARLDAECERAVLRHLEFAVDARLLDVGGLVLVRDAQDLRAQASRAERIVGIAAGAGIRRELRREQGARRDRQAVVEVEGLRPEVGRVAARDGRRRVGRIGRVVLEAGARHLARQAERRLAAARDRVVRQAACLRIVEIETERELLADIPRRVEPERFQIVLLLAMLLFVAEVLAGAGEFVQQDRCRDRFVGIELDAVEAIALQPDRLLAAILGDLVLRERVVERERQGVDRRVLHRELAVDALPLGIRERIADVVRNSVQLAVGRRIRDRRRDRVVCRACRACRWCSRTAA